jgi:phospholipase C
LEGSPESDLNTLFEALKNSKQWERMLFVVTFDEHGGTWDHVPPPKTVTPDARVSKSGFAFDRLGVRVPTLLISPYVRPGTVFRAPSDAKQDFDHTSFIATWLKWAGIDPAQAGMGQRVATAPTFEAVLTRQPHTNRPEFTVPPDYAHQGGGTGHVNMVLAGGNTLDIREFRAAADSSKNSSEFHAKVQALVAKPTPAKN